MARPKSDLLSKAYIALGIFKAIVDAILRAGGNDEDVRLIEKPELADKIAALVMAESGKPKPTIDLTGLEVREIEVDFDDPRWGKIEPKKYAYCNSNARTGDFPINSRGKRTVRYVELTFDHEPTTQEVINETERRKLQRPDRAVTETILDARKSECAERPIVGICGVVQSHVGGASVVGYVYEHAYGRDMNLRDLQSRWFQGCRFVAVVSE